MTATAIDRYDDLGIPPPLSLSVAAQSYRADKNVGIKYDVVMEGRQKGRRLPTQDVHQDYWTYYIVYCASWQKEDKRN